MNNGLIIAAIGLAGLFGLLFLARSILRLCQGKFLSALAALFLSAILFSSVGIASSWMVANARNPKVIAAIKASEKETQTNEPQPGAPGYRR
jgi:hypothetical protein